MSEANANQSVQDEQNNPARAEMSVGTDARAYNTIAKPRVTRRIWFAVGMVIILITSGGIWAWAAYEQDQQQKQIKSLYKCINEANQAEFAMYKAVPTPDISQLDMFFTRTGTARRIIQGTLERNISRNRRLRVPPSSYVLVNVAVKHMTATDARVETDEQWYLRWYDANTKRDTLLYDTLNHHLYWLQREASRWKIHMDEYRGHPRKITY